MRMRMRLRLRLRLRHSSSSSTTSVLLRLLPLLPCSTSLSTSRPLLLTLVRMLRTLLHALRTRAYLDRDVRDAYTCAPLAPRESRERAHVTQVPGSQRAATRARRLRRRRGGVAMAAFRHRSTVTSFLIMFSYY